MQAEIGRAEHEQIQKHDNAHDAVRTAEGHAVKRDKAEAEADGKRDLEKIDERVQQPVARRFAGTDKVL